MGRRLRMHLMHSYDVPIKGIIKLSVPLIIYKNIQGLARDLLN
jgi:hypothetical protein